MNKYLILKKNILTKNILTICLLLLTSCSSNKILKKEIKPTVIASISEPSIGNGENIFYIKSPDIECDLCAQSAIEALASLPGNPRVEYQKVDEGYENGFLRICTSSSTALTEEEMQQRLEAEGFAVSAVVAPSPAQVVTLPSK